MPIEFFELPQGTPSTVNLDQTATAVGYCSASDVASLNKARVLGAGNNPTLTDVQSYILMIAGEIDAVLLSKGIQVPVNAGSYPQSGNLLLLVNARGAHWMTEEASPNSPNLDRAKQAYDAALKMLRDTDFALDAPSDMERAKVRAPFITSQPPAEVFDPAMQDIGGWSGDGISSGGRDTRGLPMLSRSLRF